MMSPERMEFGEPNPGVPEDRIAQSIPNVVPTCPSGLAFNRDDFLSPDFSVDGFLSRTMTSGNDIGLERLRDDLGVYLKVLRAAMIELINEDYADFVNLSTNLVGLDKTISTLEDPLKLYVSRVEAVRDAFADTHQKLNSQLTLKEQLYQKRVALQNLQHITNTLNKIERLLNINRTKEKGFQLQEHEDNLTADMVERVAADIHHLNYCMQVCKADAFVRETQPRLKLIGDRLQQAMERQLLESILSNQEKQDSLRRCLRIYATVDRVSDAEELVRRKVISPYLDDVISEKSFNSDPQGLKGVFQRVMKLVTDNLKPLIILTQPTLTVTESTAANALGSGVIHHNGQHVLKDFDFLVRSLWPEVVEKFEDNLSFLFSAGDPDKFHTNFSQSMEFVDEFERNLVFMEDVERFRDTIPYNSFVGRWSLAVYYQIRFREIALPVELSMDTDEFLTVSHDNVTTLDGSKNLDNKPKFRFMATNNIVMALEKCWNPLIYLPAIVHRFVKLSMQILSRYNTAVQNLITAIRNEEEPKLENIKILEVSRNLSSMQLSGGDQLLSGINAETSKITSNSAKQGHTRSASDQKSDPGKAMAINEDRKIKKQKQKESLVSLFMDIVEICKHINGQFFDDIILPMVNDLEDTMKQNIKHMFSESCDSILLQRQALTAVIVEDIASKSIPHLKSVNDIQRLYRRTNRQVPSKPCPYIVSVLLPIQEFYTKTSSICANDILQNWSVHILSLVADEYLGAVSETLAAVQKMEESLRRLKKVREKTTGGTGDKTADGTSEAKISDDDKIRLQIYVDVKYFILQVEKGLKVKSTEIKSLVELDALVIEATKNCFDDYIAKIDSK